MSNFDHSIDDGLEDALKDGHYANHYGWNFCAEIWFEDGEFHSAVRRYQALVANFSAPTLRELMSRTNEVYGDE